MSKLSCDECAIPSDGLNHLSRSLVLARHRDSMLSYGSPTIRCDTLHLRSRHSRVAMYPSGRRAAWLARMVRDQEVDGSNPFAPTIFVQYMQEGSSLLRFVSAAASTAGLPP